VPVVPFTYHHRSSVIDTDDHAADLDTFDGHAHDTDDPANQHVTLADLLDARESDGSFPVDLYRAASHEVRAGFTLVIGALIGVFSPARLSPEERAEFDRRTT
jgi:hypothetical protein